MFERGYIYRTEADQRADRPSMFARQESNSGTKMTVTREVLLNSGCRLPDLAFHEMHMAGMLAEYEGRPENGWLPGPN
jgi:hypothetical protein